MTPKKVAEVTQLMAQMDLDMQDYVLDMLRHIKFTQDVLSKKNKNLPEALKEVENGKVLQEIY